MAAMAAIGALRATISLSSSSSSLTPSKSCFGFSSSIVGDRLPSRLPISRRAAVSGDAARRTPPILVSPKAISDSKNSKTYLDPVASRSVLGIILGGGVGTRLYHLNKKRAKPTVLLGANYRLIDIHVSNCLNRKISKTYVLTQFNSASLNQHLSGSYANNMGGYKDKGFVEVFAAQQSPENLNWFQMDYEKFIQGSPGDRRIHHCGCTTDR